MGIEIGKNYGAFTESTVKLKTSKPGVTKLTQIKTGFQSANDYSRYLQGRYGFMNSGKNLMSGVPTTVSVSGAFLAKCNKDPEKAKYLEENLAAIPDCVKSLADHTRTMPGNPVCTYATYIIDDDGNISCMSGCTNDPDGKIARENAERRIKEQHKAGEKAALRRKEAALNEKAAQKRARENYHKYDRGITARGGSVQEASDRIAAEIFRLCGAAGGMSFKA